MDIIKPEPLRLGDRYYYTLTSYDPVSIEVRVPRVTQADVDIALGQIVAEHEAVHNGATNPSEVPELTDEWVERELPEVKTVAALRETVTKQLEQLNAQAAEESKAGLCADELAKRLCQSVPEIEVEHVHDALLQQMAADLAHEGMTLSDFMSRAGFSQASVDAMLFEQARGLAKQDAAIDAFAQERKLKIEDGELPQYMGMSFSDANKVISEAREHGQLETLRAGALRLKAIRIVVAECSCTYVQESLEEAENRAAQYRAMMEQAAAKLSNDESDQRSEGEKRGFKLV